MTQQSKTHAPQVRVWTEADVSMASATTTASALKHTLGNDVKTVSAEISVYAI